MTEFLRLGLPGSEIPAVQVDGIRYDLRSLTADIDAEFLESDGLAGARDAARAGELAILEQRNLRIGAPIARPSAILCIGQNYAAHAAESGAEPPTAPVLFFKHPNTVVGPFDEIVMPPRARALDWEVELGVVVGKRARYLESPEQAAGCIAGYVVSHDVSERCWQLEESGGQWSKGKSAETFNPLGPYLVPADEVDSEALRIWSKVNGETRQDSTTSDIIFSAAQLVLHLSQYLVLEPGDLINTGTPQGVALSGRFPYLQPGDVVELGITGLGSARQQVTAKSWTAGQDEPATPGRFSSARP